MTLLRALRERIGLTEVVEITHLTATVKKWPITELTLDR